MESDRFRAAVEQAKLEAMKELAYGASHEINNPLANIAARAQTLIKRERDPDKLKMLQAIHRQAMRAHEMISDLMLFARPPALDKRDFAIEPLLEELQHELAPVTEEASIQITIETAPQSLAVCADRLQMGVALKALLENSIDAIGQEGEIAINAAMDETGAATIEVRDTGPGVPADVREHLFDPFFSGREAGRGLGFGLSKCWRIVTDHGGMITVDSPPAQGAIFTIRLPQRTPEQTATTD